MVPPTNFSLQDSASHWLVMNVAVRNIFMGEGSDEKQLVEDTAHLIEKQIKDATESTISSTIENSKCAIERAFAVAEEAAQHVPEIKKRVFLLQQGNKEQMVKILGRNQKGNYCSVKQVQEQFHRHGRKAMLQRERH
ncbi:hypothetical protein KIW84_076097 [Lathyrus oleraceus]|uniref:Uncharacterized protein n=1 Tax=Pisum sativum TaxID=3888 RepID=A0A9D4ZYY9_PEA|nr:hypothetical protein KIW84_076097 [Pisum sativum]